MKWWQGPKLTVKSRWFCSWVHGRDALIPAPSVGRKRRAKYSASGSVSINSEIRIGRSIGKSCGVYETRATKVALLKGLGRGVPLTHLLHRPLSVFSTSYPENRSIQLGKGPIPVYLGQTGTHFMSGYLSASYVRRRSRSSKGGDAPPHFAS